MHVESIHLYPVKGCHRTVLTEAAVEPWGLAGDRRFMVVDENDEMLTQRECRDLVRIVPRWDGVRLTLAASGAPDLVVSADVDAADVETKLFSRPVTLRRLDPAVDGWLTDVLGRKARLLWQPDPRPLDRLGSGPAETVCLADAYPLMLANTASVAAVNDWLLAAQSLEFPVPIERFRANIVMAGAPPWAEDAMAGGRISVGAAMFRAPSQAGRCVVTTTDQETGDRGREPLRVLARHRTVDQKVLFGLNLIPDAPATIRVGDEIRVL